MMSWDRSVKRDKESMDFARSQREMANSFAHIVAITPQRGVTPHPQPLSPKGRGEH